MIVVGLCDLSARYLDFKPRDGIAWLHAKVAGPVRYFTELSPVIRRFHRERVGQNVDTRRIYWTLKDQMKSWTLDEVKLSGIFQRNGRWYVDLVTFLPWLEEWYRGCFIARLPKPAPLPDPWDGTPAALPAGFYSLRAVCDRLAIQHAFSRLKKRANTAGTGIYHAKEYVVEWPNKLVLAEWSLR